MGGYSTDVIEREPAVDSQPANLFVVVDSSSGPDYVKVYGPFDSEEAAQEAQDSLILGHREDEEERRISLVDPEYVHVAALISPSSI